MRMMIRYGVMALAATAAGLATGEQARAGGYSADGTYFCPYGSYIGNGHCSDGTIAVYRGANAARPAPPGQLPSPSGLFGAWYTSLPGAVWTTNEIPGWQTLHIAPGAAAGVFVLYQNGTWLWNSYGGKRGRWSASGDSEYPILLDDRKEGRKWKVGFNTKEAGTIWIVESDGYFWYKGKR